MKIGIIGSGRWATFLAWYAARVGHEVILWGRETSARFKQLRETRRNATITLPSNIQFTGELRDLHECDLILVGVAAQSLREVLGAWDKNVRIPMVLCMKGLESQSGLRLSQVAAQALGEDWPVAVWLGPGHPQDFAQEIPNCMVIDSVNDALTRKITDAFNSPLIRMYYGTDLIGNEIGAAAKNVIGIAAGMLDGSGRTSLKGPLMARAPYEISLLVVAMGGDIQSVYGLCHLGDYEATLFSQHSNNRLFGENYMRGIHSEKLAEGYYSLPAFVALANELNVEMPICQGMYEVFYNGANPDSTLDRLMTRQTRYEF